MGQLGYEASVLQSDGVPVVMDSGNSGENFSPYAMRNKIINGGFDVCQLGTIIEANTDYLSDMWIGRTVAGGSSADIDFRKEASGGALLRTSIVDTTRVEISNGVVLPVTDIGKTVTFSLEVFIEAAYANIATSILKLKYLADSMNSWDGSDVETIPFNTIAVDTWVKVEGTFTIPSFVEFLGVSLRVDDSAGIGGSLSVIRCRNVQLEEGAVSTPFEQRPIGMELDLCQRYFKTLGMSLGAGAARLPINYQEMRGLPTVTNYDDGNLTVEFISADAFLISATSSTSVTFHIDSRL